MKMENIHKTKKVKIRKANKTVNSYIITIPTELMSIVDYDENDYAIWDYTLNFDKNNVDINIDFKKADEIDAPDEVDAEDP